MYDQGWYSWSPREKAAMIRAHAALNRVDVCALFLLTREGLRRIMNGEDWRSEFASDLDAIA